MSSIVLLVEDDDILRELAADALSLLDAHVIACRNADQALLELERSTKIDLVLTDIRMPGHLDGARFANVVAERWPQLPIVVTSGNRLPSDILPKNAMFVPKPWTLDVLFQQVQPFLKVNP